jgi:RNA polymerase sigma-70 factor (ECF subfamily)
LDPWGQDEALARRCLAGDEAAWRELVDCHGPRVFSVCLASGLRTSEAEDVCQEVMVSALRSLRGYGGCRLSTWLYRITRRRIADHLRSRNRRDVARGFPGDPGFPELDAGACLQRDGAARMSLYDELRRELARLPEPTRSVLIAYHVCEVPVREIALDLGMPENTVKSHLRRGRGLVRERLEEA